MRLLHTRDHTFKEFIGDKIPPYAIISHRWSEEEVSHQDFLENKQSLLERQSESYGWLKIMKGCQLALRDDFEWMWVDTCCIDKKSSAELSEAINSMFKWYKRSGRCYVFLPDVHAIGGFNYAAGEAEFSVEEFKFSSWFTRAWTLQELIAPREVLFFNTEFSRIGDKSSLNQFVKEVTGMRYTSSAALSVCSISEKMSWASKRKATRPEDMACSLLGLFGISMPLLYGEGGRAFYRLQLEIIRESDDESIFAWHRSLLRPYFANDGLLALDASCFLGAIDYRIGELISREHYEITNKGLRMTCNFPNSFLRSSQSREEYQETLIMPLNVYKPEWHREQKEEILTPCLRFRVYSLTKWETRTEPERAAPRYFTGIRKGLVVTASPSLQIHDIEKAAKRFKDSKDFFWDYFCGEDDGQHTAIPVYFPLQSGLRD